MAQPSSEPDRKPTSTALPAIEPGPSPPSDEPKTHDPILPITAADAESKTSSRKFTLENVNSFLHEEVDLDLASIPLSMYCFMTGYIDAISFTACFIWCAFQTGNTIQLSLAIARLFSGEDQGPGFHMPDRQALVSLASFLGGAAIGRLGDKIGSKKRRWLVIGTLLQAALTLGACLTAHYSHQSGFSTSRTEPSWTNAKGFLALAFASASMGLQAHIGTRLGAQFATTVVLTTIWVQFITEPLLFKVNRVHKPRDYKALAIVSLFIGGLVGRALTGTIGAAGALGLGAGLRVLIALSWFLIPRSKK